MIHKTVVAYASKGGATKETSEVIVGPRLVGTFTVNPRINYLAEEGDQKTEKPEPVTVMVKDWESRAGSKEKGSAWIVYGQI